MSLNVRMRLLVSYKTPLSLLDCLDEPVEALHPLLVLAAPPGTWDTVSRTPQPQSCIFFWGNSNQKGQELEISGRGSQANCSANKDHLVSGVYKTGLQCPTFCNVSPKF